jgi:hypothetical protein
MGKYVFVVFSAAAAGREDEFNRWYDGQHVRDVLNVPGFVAAQRFRLAQPPDGSSAPYLALYEMETDDPGKALAELNSRAGTSAMVLSDALDVTRVSAVLYAAHGSKVAASGHG